MNYAVKNSARLVGEVVNKFSTDKVTILTVNTGRGAYAHDNFPKAVCFEKVKPIADQIQIGDKVLLNCTIQANKRNEAIQNQAMRTIAVNHVRKIRDDDERYHPVNQFSFRCRIVSTRRISRYLATARIFFYTTKPNYMIVAYRGETQEDVDAFCEISSNDYVQLSGSIETNRLRNQDGSWRYTEDCVVNSYRVFERKRNNANAASSADANQ